MNKFSMLQTMQKIRVFETEIGEAVERGEIKTPCHLSIGQEAVAVGVCKALRKTDLVYGTHRSHALYIAKGGNIDRLRDEIYGKETGCMNGRGGSMHLKAPEVGFVMSSPIVGGTVPLAVGSALAFKMQKKDSVVVAFFGDGATNEGVFWESLNFAALHKLPVVFVCENNGYATHMPFNKHTFSKLETRVSWFGVKASCINDDVEIIYEVMRDLVNEVRNGDGPRFLEIKTNRECGHVGIIDERKMK